MPGDESTSTIIQLLQRQHIETLQRLTQLEERVNQSLQLSQENNRALKGTNGGTGLISQVATLTTQSQKECNDTLAKLKEFEELLFEGTDDQPGLVEQVHDLRRWQKSTKYWTALLIGATLVGLLNIVIQIVLHPLMPH